MSDDADERVFGLIAAAEDQQKMVQAVLARLAAQEDALARERQLLAEDRATLRAEIAALRQTAGTVGPALQRSMRDAVGMAIADSMTGAGETAARAVTAAARPALDRLAGVAATAQEVEASLRRVVGWVTWRLLGKVGAVAAGCLLVVVLGNVAIGWWDGRAIAADQAQKALLEAQIAGLQDTRDQLVQAGGRAVITRCGPSARLCIQVDGGAPAYAEGLKSYRIIEGY
jgi:cell division protein FtsB